MTQPERLKHEIIHHGPRRFECPVCQQTWVARPKSICPGMKCYPQYNCGRLMTKTQLQQSGYHTSEDRLPIPAGCYREYSNFKFILLYDPDQAIKKRMTKRPRTTISVTDIFWPVAWLPILNAASQKPERDETTFRQFADVLQMTFQLVFFTQAEIEQMAGECIALVIPPLIIHRSYALFLRNHNEQKMLMRALFKVYEYHRR